MKKVKFIYNPFSGENSITMDIDTIIKIHQKYNYSVHPFRIGFKYNISMAFEDIEDNYNYVLIAGGDGTVDKILNYMKQNHIELPIAILPAGTANDFSKFIGMPLDVEESCEQILNSKPKKVDIGKINNSYFLNVASTGLFTDVSQKTDVNLKNTIGKLAYYVKGFEQLPNFRKLKIKVSSKEMNFDEDMYLMMVFNGQTAGNFNLAYKAELDDGLLDVIIIKAVLIRDIIGLFIKLLRLEHLEDVPGIIYFKTDRLEIECFEDIVTDIDGERGPDFPITITCEREAIELLGVKSALINNM